MHVNFLKLYNTVYFLPKIFAPSNKTKTNNTRKIKNKTLATAAAPAAIPVKPKTAAIIAITKNMAAHFSMIEDLKVYNDYVSIKIHSTKRYYF